MKSFLYIVFILLSIPVFSENSLVNIKGCIQDFSGEKFGNKPFTIEYYNDFITEKTEVLSSSKSDENGNFEVDFSIPNTGFFLINFGKIQRTLHAQPGSTFYIDIKAPIKKLNQSVGHFAQDVRPAEIKFKNNYPFNAKIEEWDKAFSDFLYFETTKRRDPKAVLAFCDSVKGANLLIKNEYLKEYLNWKSAELQMFQHRTQRKKYFDKFFRNAKNISKNVQAMHVFNAFFNEYMYKEIALNGKHKIQPHIVKGNLSATLNLIYPGSSNRELNELILLKGISEIHNKKFYKEEALNYLLTEIIKTTPFENHKTIAKNILTQTNLLREGFPAPNISIKSTFEEFNLEEFRGKYVYLCFFRTWDETFIEELKIIKILQDIYHENLQIVCISADQDIESYKNLKQQYSSANWTFIHYNFNNKILNDYFIEDYRIDRYDKTETAKYYLIGPQGNIIFSPAKAPSQRFEYDFRKLIES